VLRTDHAPLVQMNEDYEALIKQRSLAKWSETLAILLTYAKPDFARLSCKLAERLQRSSMTHAAIICYICASNVDAAITLWLHESRETAMPIAQLQRVLEKSIALGLATRDPTAAHNQALADLIANYALQLVNEGCLASAMKYLVIPDTLPADASPALAVLKDRVYKAAGLEQVRCRRPLQAKQIATRCSPVDQAECRSVFNIRLQVNSVFRQPITLTTLRHSDEHFTILSR
jgi:protein transport protein SEC31